MLGTAGSNGKSAGTFADREVTSRAIPAVADARQGLPTSSDRPLDLVAVPGDRSADSIVDAPFTMPDTAPSVESATGVHAITRNTNYWFEREVSQIEKQATTMALDWAVKGLPRHDVPRTEPLEPEQVLAKRCSQLFKEWQQRVSTKFKDAIEDGNQQIAAHAGSVRAAVIRLEAINDEEQECAAEMKRIRAESEKDSGPIGYEKLWKSRNGFWIVAGLLGIVEFMANFPVFRLLLPMSSVWS